MVRPCLSWPRRGAPEPRSGARAGRPRRRSIGTPRPTQMEQISISGVSTGTHRSAGSPRGRAERPELSPGATHETHHHNRTGGLRRAGADHTGRRLRGRPLAHTARGADPRNSRARHGQPVDVDLRGRQSAGRPDHGHLRRHRRPILAGWGAGRRSSGSANRTFRFPRTRSKAPDARTIRCANTGSPLAIRDTGGRGRPLDGLARSFDSDPGHAGGQARLRQWLPSATPAIRATARTAAAAQPAPKSTRAIRRPARRRAVALA